MSALNLAYDLANYTPADANPMQSNFQRVEQFINTELVNRDGSVAMTGQLKLVGDPVAPLDAATKQFVDLLLPIGVMLPYPAPGAAPGAGTWAIANGAVLQTTDYAELFAKYQYSWGGSGGTFSLPNMSGRVPVGAGGALGGAVGAVGGSKDAVVVTHQHNAKHAHGATAGAINMDHFHLMRNHGHSASSTAAGNHAHGWGPEAFAYNSTVPSGYGLTDNGAIRTANWSADGNHAHPIAVGAPTDNTSNWWSESIVFSNPSPSKTPTVTVAENNFDTAAPGGSPVAAGTNGANMPPYAVVQWIVRCR